MHIDQEESSGGRSFGGFVALAIVLLLLLWLWL
ncbi:hypothetical protein J2X65_002532 [Ancylobacter sp. 3268]|nr:hypothetical protein [Ancylobacter sp. 3268]